MDHGCGGVWGDRWAYSLLGAVGFMKELDSKRYSAVGDVQIFSYFILSCLRIVL